MDATTAWVIYALSDPRDGAVRYVGWTESASRRLRAHVNEARCAASRGERMARRVAWTASLLAAGVAPAMQILQRGRGDGWAQAERRWIARHRAQGADLVNATDGGEGVVGLVFSAEARAKMRAAKLGRKMPPGTGAKIAAANRGKRMSAEARAKISKARKEKSWRYVGWSREAVERARAANTGKKKAPRTPEERARIRRGITEWWAKRKGRDSARSSAITAAWKAHNGSGSLVAKTLGVSKSTLYREIKRLGIGADLFGYQPATDRARRAASSHPLDTL